MLLLPEVSKYLNGQIPMWDVSKDTTGFSTIDMNAYGPFPFLIWALNMDCEDGIALTLNMSAVELDKVIIEDLKLNCNYISRFNDVHFTIP